MQGLRAQIDRDKYKSNMQHEIFNTNGLSVLEESVEDLVIDSTNRFPHRKVTGVCLSKFTANTSLLWCQVINGSDAACYYYC